MRTLTQALTLTSIATAVRELMVSGIYGGAYGAYDLRIPATSSYAGPIIRVRRSSDNAESDIPALSTADLNGDKWLNEAALLSFVGTASAHVVKWYDQSGAGLAATQTDPILQPRIVNAGVIDRLNVKPTIVFSGAQKLGTSVFNAGAYRNFMGAVVARDDSGGAFIERVFVVQSTGGAADYLGTLSAVLVAGYNAGAAIWAFRNGLDLASAASTGGQGYQALSWFNGSHHNMQRNAGTVNTFAFAHQYLGSAVQLWIGGSRTNDGPFAGAISAAAFYPELPDGAARSAIASSQMLAYSI